jgi:hypothetical protein
MIYLKVERQSYTWLLTGSDIDGMKKQDYIGHSVSLSSDGTIVATGGPYNVDGTNPGVVRVYQYNGSTWNQLGQDIDGEAVGDWSGFSVSLSPDGTTVAIGAIYNRFTAGHVRVYNYDGSEWKQLGSDIDGEAAYGDLSGYSVSLSLDGTTVAIGAPGNDDSVAGYVCVYHWDETTWIKLGQDIDGEAAGDQSGYSVSLSSDGTTVAIGAMSNDGSAGENSGHVRVYKYNGSEWKQLGLDIDGEAANDYSGTSVSLSSDGTTVAIGAPYNGAMNNNIAGDYVGHVRVYNYDGSEWKQLGSDIDGEAANDYSGTSVSLSSDGTTVAIGAPYTAVGYVRVYKYNGSEWNQLAQDIDGEAAGDSSGRSVSLSSDGTTVAIGAPYNDVAAVGNDAGHVRVYKLVIV